MEPNTPELNRLHLMDCMEGMRQFPDKYFELAIVDPPYGVGSVTYMPRKRVPAHGGSLDHYEITIATLDMNQRRKLKTQIAHGQATGSPHFGDENIAPPPEYFEELFRVSNNQIIWGGNYFLLPPSRCFIAWRKTNVSENFSMAMCEYAWVSVNSNAKYCEFNPQGQGKRFHPTQKPVALYEFCLKHFAKPGDKILDTHAGSASCLIAAHRLGYQWLGFEIDPDYHRQAVARLEDEMAQGRLLAQANDNQLPPETGAAILRRRLPTNAAVYAAKKLLKGKIMSAQDNISKSELTTTLNAIRACAPCAEGWETLLSGLNKTVTVDEPLALTRILEINGIDDAIWALRTVMGHDNAIRLFACACARYSLDFFERVYPDDKRPRRAIETSERFVRNKATQDELAAAWAAAWGAAGGIYVNGAAKSAAWAAAWGAAGDIAEAVTWAADAAALAAIDSADAAEATAWAYIEKEFIRLCALEGEYGKVD